MDSTERCDRAPIARSKSNRLARPTVGERMNNVVRNALKAIDLAPRRFPCAEIGGESIGRRGERREQPVAGGLCRKIFVGGNARCTRGLAKTSLKVLAPVNR